MQCERLILAYHHLAHVLSLSRYVCSVLYLSLKFCYIFCIFLMNLFVFEHKTINEKIADTLQVNTTNLEQCVPFMRFDHFTGNEVTYIFTLVGLASIPISRISLIIFCYDFYYNHNNFSLYRNRLFTDPEEEEIGHDLRAGYSLSSENVHCSSKSARKRIVCRHGIFHSNHRKGLKIHIAR